MKLYKDVKDILDTYNKVDIDFIQLDELYVVFMDKNYLSAGICYNPFIAGYITAKTRLELYKNAIPYKDDIIMFATDSIISTRRILRPRKGLGRWDLEEKGEGIFIGNGLYQINQKTKHRGFEIKHIEYNKKGEKVKKKICLKDFMKKNKNVKELKIITERLKGFAKLKDYDKEYNTIMDTERTINFNYMDYKRQWNNNNLCSNDLLTDNFDSNPLTI